MLSLGNGSNPFKSLATTVLLTASLTVGGNVFAENKKIAYLGPEGAWSHQASADLYGADQELLGMTREEWISAFNNREIDVLILPVTTSVVGVTPYMDDVLELKGAVIMGEYPKMLSYDLLAKPGAKFEDIKRVLAHPVAHSEVKPWMDKEMPNAERINAASGGAAAKEVSEGDSLEVASMGPKIASQVYELVSLRDHIEEGPHNVTRWWILGFEPTPPTGNDKTTLLAEVKDDQFSALMKGMLESDVTILTIYERPDLKTIDGHRYLIEVEGHAQVGALKSYLDTNKEIRVLGSYPKKT
ncbi:prephenate dehydratase [Paenalcaligenes hominis]|uniref:prephenate dehydratase n=1 Tax=Paenalcaligenes hominis TaxID=643674 RepID=UPI0035238B47